ncbi:hypothetical protein [Paenibacillus tengchongensis]|uniref:hypothetical protein n=1 Tax=Paenibacillus tengchongensis TaxID=2608684 RepID=UPI00124DA4B6|nr:hypothetical protein [Paenibacillus tengchongensis]
MRIRKPLRLIMTALLASALLTSCEAITAQHIDSSGSGSQYGSQPGIGGGRVRGGAGQGMDGAWQGNGSRPEFGGRQGAGSTPDN